ncbi:MAG: bifunctional enoyl-CoA hydratase/phosphate acetyltransferase, partial [Pseudomonadota bacterium]
VMVQGKAQVQAPLLPLSFDDRDLPGLVVQTHRQFDAILKRAQALPALTTAVVWPDEAQALQGALLAQAQGLILPVLIGPTARIRALAGELGVDLGGVELVEAASESAAAVQAVALARAGKVQAIMKGYLHTDVLLHPMLDHVSGLRIGRRLTHVFVLDVPGLSHPLLVSDGAINIAPDLTTKVDIVQNAIDLAHALGIAQPKVAVLSAVETVSPDMPSSMDAAALSKMAERGQITGGLVDGPLAMDNAVSMAAARTKGIAGSVAGQAQVLIVPNLDAGNILVKLLTHLAHAEAAGLVMGASVPVLLTSRADGPAARVISAALAVLQVHAQAKAGVR